MSFALLFLPNFNVRELGRPLAASITSHVLNAPCDDGQLNGRFRNGGARQGRQVARVSAGHFMEIWNESVFPKLLGDVASICCRAEAV
jgi:hypothetical protein